MGNPLLQAKQPEAHARPVYHDQFRDDLESQHAQLHPQNKEESYSAA